MSAIRLQATIDEATAQALPGLRPLLGQRVELVATQTADQPAKQTKRLTLDELLALRVEAAPDARPLSNEDIERAIIQGALDGDS